jgi:TonB family protein
VTLWGLHGLLFPAAPDGEPRQDQQSPIAFELVEVPDYVRQQQPDTETNLVSDRATRATDPNPDDLDDMGAPYSAGGSDIAQYEERASGDSPKVSANSTDTEEPSEQGDMAIAEPGTAYSADMVGNWRAGSTAGSAAFENLLSSSPRQGGISFNTYDWDFAPYLLAMKRKIESHMYPPYAFTHMGLVHGTNVVCFKVLPDGHVEGLELLASDAHFSLDRTSLRAVELSMPFPPLPRSFPEDELVVTAYFSYRIDR